ncbi:hypothetical protein [Sinorhizobium meliloti]|uniref:hypothetical protein n=1 Tax=Rhizobium meliloti TaxID=382 RepID=UPI000FDB685A|nr:hypothetical protein [Sinorhizobium meliloti]RVG91350.1 hypothetical protein CN218_21085 [Sinorhizobium meliloti]
MADDAELPVGVAVEDVNRVSSEIFDIAVTATLETIAPSEQFWRSLILMSIHILLLRGPNFSANRVNLMVVIYRKHNVLPQQSTDFL